MRLNLILSEIFAQFSRVRCGLDVGFADETVTNTLRNSCGGVWMSIDAREEMPFDDAQFEVVVLNGVVVTRPIIREINRILKSEGCLFFTVMERTRKQDGFTIPELYRLIREGFDLLVVRRPKWWFLRSKNRTITICARKKAWHEHKNVMINSALPFSPFRARKR